jgi:mediator of DNA damage checkpoint protein 1
MTQALEKLGVKMTSRAGDATHLIAPRIVRTEKMLCAIAQGAYILDEKWATDSADKKQLLRTYSVDTDPVFG